MTKAEMILKLVQLLIDQEDDDEIDMEDDDELDDEEGDEEGDDSDVGFESETQQRYTKQDGQ